MTASVYGTVAAANNFKAEYADNLGKFLEVYCSNAETFQTYTAMSLLNGWAVVLITNGRQGPDPMLFIDIIQWDQGMNIKPNCIDILPHAHQYSFQTTMQGNLVNHTVAASS